MPEIAGKELRLGQFGSVRLTLDAGTHVSVFVVACLVSGPALQLAVILRVLSVRT